MLTLVPDWNEPPSTAYWVSDAPDPASEAERSTVTSEDCQPLGALSVVAGGVLSTRLGTTVEEAGVPATQTPAARGWQRPASTLAGFPVSEGACPVPAPGDCYSCVSAGSPG